MRLFKLPLMMLFAFIAAGAPCGVIAGFGGAFFGYDPLTCCPYGLVVGGTLGVVHLVRHWHEWSGRN